MTALKSWMRLVPGVILLALATTNLVPGSPPSNRPSPSPNGPLGPGLDSFDRVMFVSELLARHKIPGGALAIARNGHLVLLRGYGYGDVGHRVTVDPARTRFALGSSSKSFTAAAILRLVDEGKMSLDDLVVDRLPPAAPGPDRQTIPAGDGADAYAAYQRNSPNGPRP